MDAEPRVSGVVLAAGESRRFGGEVPKQLFAIDGEPLVRRVARVALASRLRQILVVVGHESARVASVLAGLAVEVVDNRRYREGQSTSVQAALDRVEPGAEGAMFLPCDQPFLSSDLIDRLLGEFARTGGPIVVPTYRGQRRAPVTIARSFFDRLEAITGDEGARQLFRQHPEKIVELPVDDPRPFDDLDRAPR